jgi:hypothetical protein
MNLVAADLTWRLLREQTARRFDLQLDRSTSVRCLTLPSDDIASRREGSEELKHALEYVVCIVTKVTNQSSL